MIITFTRLLVLLGVGLGLATGGCARSSPEAPEPDARTAASRDLAGDVLGALKLVRQEYGNAVAPAGAVVVDATESAETELFAEQAERKAAAWRAAGGLADAAQGEALARRLADLRAAIEKKAPQQEVAEAAAGAIAIVQQAMAGAIPESIRGVVLAVTRTDETVQAEEVAGDYRIGVFAEAAQPIFVRSGATLAAAPAAPAGAVYFGVALRERRTKRPLAAAAVDVVLAGQGRRVEARLDELWGDFHQYGANVVPPEDGPVTITVRVEPPASARHGDMLNAFVMPATVTIAAHVRGGALAFDAKPVAPIDADYALGDDMLQALAEVGELHDAGPYRIGLIVEGPEPIWQWRSGKPVLEPAGGGATNHVEVVLVDRETGQLVPRAKIDLVFLAGDSEVGTATLVPLMSVFSHYGRTITVPPGTGFVRIHVQPPAMGALGRPRLADPADITLPLPAQRKEA